MEKFKLLSADGKNFTKIVIHNLLNFDKTVVKVILNIYVGAYFFLFFENSFLFYARLFQINCILKLSYLFDTLNDGLIQYKSILTSVVFLDNYF